MKVFDFFTIMHGHSIYVVKTSAQQRDHLPRRRPDFYVETSSTKNFLTDYEILWLFPVASHPVSRPFDIAASSF